MALTPYLAITDLTTTCLFADGASPPGPTNYRVVYGSWSPAMHGAVPPLMRSGLYGDVVETMRISITGSTPAQALANLRTLTTLLEQAQYWRRGYSVAPVFLHYSPGGGTVSSVSDPLRAIITGYAPGASSAITLPSEFDGPRLLNSRWIIDATLSFSRSEWRLARPTTSSPTTLRVSVGPTADNSVIRTLTFTGPEPAHYYPLCYSLEQGTSTIGTTGMILFATSSSALDIRDATSVTGSGEWTIVSDAANLARGAGNVVRFTPATTSVSTSPAWGGLSAMRRPMFMIMMRNNSSTITYRLRVRISHTSYDAYTRWRVVPTTTSPFILTIPATDIQPNLVHSVRLEVAATATGSSLDINSIAILDADSPTSQMLSLSSYFGRFVARHSLIRDDRTHIALRNHGADDVNATIESVSTAEHLVTYSPAGLFGRGNTMYVLPLLTSGSRWAQSTSGGALDTITHRLTRRPVYLVPE